MALIDELKEMRASARDRMSECLTNASSYEELAKIARDHIADIDRAIAALEPAPIPEPETQTGDDDPNEFEDFESDDEADRKEADEFWEAQLKEKAPDDEAQRAAAIELTADVWTQEELDALDAKAAALAELIGAPQIDADPIPQPEWNEPQQTEGYAPVTNPTIDDLIPEAMRQELEAEQRYAQPTNPEADFWSRGLASDQKPQSRFNIFGIKPKVDA
jgi:hypothetical protein